MIKRNTKQRLAVLDLLRQTDSHPTADWMYDELRKVMPHISKGTVYRNLKVLREMGEITDLDMIGGITRFEGRLENHYHFRCESCGRVFDLDEPIMNELDTKIAEKTGFKVSCHRLEFRGLCHHCQQQGYQGN